MDLKKQTNRTREMGMMGGMCEFFLSLMYLLKKKQSCCTKGKKDGRASWLESFWGQFPFLVKRRAT